MVFLTGLALFAFVVLPVLDQYMRQNAGTRNEQVLATFDGQNLTRERVEGFTRGHRATLFFLQDLAQRTLESGRQPQTAGFQQGTQGNITGLGINPEPSVEGSIRTFVFAGQATKKGFALSDSELAVWLERFCDGLYTEAELNSLAKKTTSNSMNLPMIKEQLRLHMLAQVFINRGYAGLRVTTPDQTWRSFKKLNQKATANTYGVLVSDYLDEVEKLEVDSAGVTELYNEGKDKFKNPDSSEAGFRRRYSATFQFISGSPESFMADEISKLTEEELRAAYKLRVDGAKMMLPAEPAAEPKAEPAAEPKAEPAEGDSSRAFQASAVRLVTAQNQDENAGDEKNIAAAKTDTASEEKPSEEKPSEESVADSGQEEPPVAEEPAVGTFEEERAFLERQLASPKAQARLEKAMESVFNEMQSYFNEESIRSGMSAESREKMVIKKPDLEALAKSYGLTFAMIGPHDALSIRDEPISNSQVAGTGMMQQQPSFVQLMYTLTPSGDPEKPLFSPLQTSALDLANFALSKQYVSWKVEDREAYIPTLDEVRDEVVSEWRLNKARVLATEAANEIAKTVNASADATLAGSVPEDKKKDFLNESLPAFQWMDPSFSPRMMQILSQLGGQIPPGISPDSATIGNVPDLDNVGEEFMEAVFTASVNQAKTASNRTGTVVYVVQPTEFMPSADILHEQFKQPQNRNAQVVQMLSGGDNASVLNGFFESVDKDAGYSNFMLDDE